MSDKVAACGHRLTEHDESAACVKPKGHVGWHAHPDAGTWSESGKWLPASDSLTSQSEADEMIDPETVLAIRERLDLVHADTIMHKDHTESLNDLIEILLGTGETVLDSLQVAARLVIDAHDDMATVAHAWQFHRSADRAGGRSECHCRHCVWLRPIAADRRNLLP